MTNTYVLMVCKVYMCIEFTQHLLNWYLIWGSRIWPHRRRQPLGELLPLLAIFEKVKIDFTFNEWIQQKITDTQDQKSSIYRQIESEPLPKVNLDGPEPCNIFKYQKFANKRRGQIAQKKRNSRATFLSWTAFFKTSLSFACSP